MTVPKYMPIHLQNTIMHFLCLRQHNSKDLTRNAENKKNKTICVEVNTRKG